MKKLAFALCTVLLVFGLSFGGYAFYMTPVAYMDVDINPSIELGVNTFDHVVKATAFNRDGEDVLGDSDVIGQKLDKVVAVLVESAKDKEYIKKSDAPVVSLTAVTDNSRKGARIAEKAKDAAEAVLNDTEDELAVTVDVVALARREEAQKLGITPGKLNLVQKLMAMDNSDKTTADEYIKNNFGGVTTIGSISVKDIMSRTKTLRSAGKSDKKDVDPSDGNGKGNAFGKDKEKEKAIENEDPLKTTDAVSDEAISSDSDADEGTDIDEGTDATSGTAGNKGKGNGNAGDTNKRENGKDKGTGSGNSSNSN